MAGYTSRSPQGEETLYADGVVVSQVSKSRHDHIGRVPPFVGLARRNGGVYAENMQGMDLDRALQAAGLDFRVVVGTTYGKASLPEPMLTTEGVLSELVLEDKRHKSTIGIWPDGRGVVFGQPRKRYQIVQPGECAELGQAVLGMGHQLVAAGSYGVPLGSSMYLAFHVGTVTVGGVDKHDMYAHLINSFDGHGGLKLAFAPIRFACTNQTTMTFGRHSQVRVIRHMGDMASKMEGLRESLRQTFTWTERFQTAADKLLTAPMGGRELVEFADTVLATPPRVTSAKGDQVWGARRAQFLEVALYAEHNDFGRHTRYGAYNALTSVLDHDMWDAPVHHSGGPRRATARWERMLDGVGDETRLKERAARLLLAGL